MSFFRSLSRTTRILLIVTMVWMVLIFCFSAQNADDSSAVSSHLLEDLLAFFTPGWETMTMLQRKKRLNAFHTVFRKCGHFTEYAILGVLLTLFFRIGHTEKQEKPYQRLWMPPMLALCYAFTDEFHQLFVPGRSCELRDVLIDFSGSLLGILIVSAVIVLRRRRKTVHPV